MIPVTLDANETRLVMHATQYAIGDLQDRIAKVKDRQAVLSKDSPELTDSIRAMGRAQESYLQVQTAVKGGSFCYQRKDYITRETCEVLIEYAKHTRSITVSKAAQELASKIRNNVLYK